MYGARVRLLVVLLTLSLAACGTDERPVGRLPSTPSPNADRPATEARAERAEWGGLRVHDIGAGDRVLVLMHGYRARGDDLVPLGRRIAATTGYRVVAPEAPLASGPGRAWFEIEAGRRSPAEVEAARAALRGVLATLRSQGARDDHIVVGGFSQGAMLSLDLALMTDEPLGGLVVMSGGPLPFWRDRPRPHLPVFMSHGRQDDVLAFGDATRIAERLRHDGADVELHAFDGGHAIPPEVVTALVAFLRARASAP